MSQSKERLDRTCKSCLKVFHSTAKELKQHCEVCNRMNAAGLIYNSGVTLK